jgi:hypothetical protein
VILFSSLQQFPFLTMSPIVNNEGYSLSACWDLFKFRNSYYKSDRKIQWTKSGRVPYLDRKLKAHELRKHVLSFSSCPSPSRAAPRPRLFWKALPRPLVSPCFRSTAGQSWGPEHPLLYESQNFKNPNVMNSVSWGCKQCLWHPPGRLPATSEFLKL